MKKKIIAILIAVSLIGTSCFADTNTSAMPENNTSVEETTAGDVAKHIVLSPFYVVVGAIELSKLLVITTLAIGKTAIDMVIPDSKTTDTNTTK